MQPDDQIHGGLGIQKNRIAKQEWDSDDDFGLRCTVLQQENSTFLGARVLKDNLENALIIAWTERRNFCSCPLVQCNEVDDVCIFIFELNPCIT